MYSKPMFEYANTLLITLIDLKLAYERREELTSISVWSNPKMDWTPLLCSIDKFPPCQMSCLP